MSAEELGRGLLAGVDEAGLSEVLASARALRDPNPSSHYFGILPLDALCSTHIAQRPTRPQPSSTHANRASDGSFLTLPPGHAIHATAPSARFPVLELVSTGSGGGRTQLLHLITALAVLPERHADIAIGGGEAVVVVVDTDDRFDVRRLAQVMRNHLHAFAQRAPSLRNADAAGIVVGERASSDEGQPLSYDSARAAERSRGLEEVPSLDAHTCDAVIASSLDHVHILRPQSYSSLLSTLHFLPTYLLNLPRHRSGPRRLHSVMLDSATTFSWQIRAEEAARDGPATGDGGGELAGQALATLRTMLPPLLEDIQSHFECAIVVTSTATNFAVTSPIAQLRPLRLLLGRKSVPPFPVETSIEDALAQREQRQRVVEKGEFSAAVLGREGLGKASGAGGFRFWISRDGLLVEGRRTNEERDCDGMEG